jgi:hypothetical protein
MKRMSRSSSHDADREDVLAGLCRSFHRGSDCDIRVANDGNAAAIGATGTGWRLLRDLQDNHAVMAAAH